MSGPILFSLAQEVFLKQFNGLQMVKYQEISQKRSRFIASLRKNLSGYTSPTISLWQQVC